MRWTVLKLALVTLMALGAAAHAEDATFRNIDGGEIRLADYRGGPVLVVNTASRCGFTYQYEGLQALQNEYGERGLTVLTVPSDDFNQELATNEAVKEFCEINYGLDLPMTEKTSVRGRGAHPFYARMKAEHGFEPGWNFYKVLLDGEGRYVDDWGSNVKPGSPLIRKKIEAALGGDRLGG